MTEESVVNLYSYLVNRIAHKYIARGVPLDDLVQVAYMGLLNAWRHFDHNSGTLFKTFATCHIEGSIKHYFRDHTWYLKVPRQLKESYQTMAKVIEGLTHELHRSPTISEIAVRMGLSEEQVIEIMVLKDVCTPYSLDSLLNENDNSGSCVVDKVAEESFEERVINALDLEFAHQSLSRQDRKVVYLRYAAGMSQSEIAENIGVSQMQVCRILKRSLEKMNGRLNAYSHQSQPKISK